MHEPREAPSNPHSYHRKPTGTGIHNSLIMKWLTDCCVPVIRHHCENGHF
uniref:Uncharacterized protein n=1 Tax=Pan troglodytes TaxID=9598 RepID=G2HHP3_PANTR|nr:hypothetical protein [Pan troglodytes]